MKLVGTIHFDLKGPDRLKKILEAYKPEKLAFECLETNKNLTDINQIYQQRKGMKKTRIDFLDMNDLGFPGPFLDYVIEKVELIDYELIVSMEYAKKEGIEIASTIYYPKIPSPKLPIREYMDIHEELKQEGLSGSELKKRIEHIKQMEQELSERMYTDPKLCGEELMGVEKNLSNYFEGRGIEKEDAMSACFNQEREELTAKALRKINPDMYVCGLGHISSHYGYKETHGVTPLCELLEDMVTEKIKLCEADNF